MKLNFDKLAEEYGLEIEKSDVGMYKQWKNAYVRLYLPGRAGGCHILGAIFPPGDAIDRGFETLSLWSDLRPERGGLCFHRHDGNLSNDTFNEHYIREEIEKAIKVLNVYKKNNDRDA